MRTPRTPQPPQDPLEPETLVDELIDELSHARHVTAADDISTRQAALYNRSVVYDTVLAMLIRFRLPIDADSALKAVRGAEPDASSRENDHRWARGCAQYISAIARAAAGGTDAETTSGELAS